MLVYFSHYSMMSTLFQHSWNKFKRWHRVTNSGKTSTTPFFTTSESTLLVLQEDPSGKETKKRRHYLWCLELNRHALQLDKGRLLLKTPAETGQTRPSISRIQSLKIRRSAYSELLLRLSNCEMFGQVRVGILEPPLALQSCWQIGWDNLFFSL